MPLYNQVYSLHNQYGVLDHTVVLPNGTEVYVPMRMIPNGKGSEVMLVLFRQPGMDDTEFARDAGLMQNDLWPHQGIAGTLSRIDRQTGSSTCTQRGGRISNTRIFNPR